MSRMVSTVEVERFMNALARSPLSALLLDYDGILAPFSINRDQALPCPGMSALLQEFIVNGRTRVVIITGRSAREVVRCLRFTQVPRSGDAMGWSG